jgi:DNA polymerase
MGRLECAAGPGEADTLPGLLFEEAMCDLVLDFETANPVVDLKVVGADVYARHWATEILCLQYKFVENGSARSDILEWRPGGHFGLLYVAVQEPRQRFVAHNAGFEQAIWRHIMVPVYGFPDVPVERWHDIMAVCAYKHLPLALEKAVPALRLPVEKDMVGSRFTKSLSRFRKGGLDRSSAALDRVSKYCEQDIRAEVLLHNRLRELSDSEREVWLLDQKINARGVKIDIPFVRAAQIVVDKALAPLAAEFTEITGLPKIGQTAKLLEWANARGADLPNLRKETLEGVDDDEENFSEDDIRNLPDDVRRALSIRSIAGSASIKKLRRMDQCVGPDDRVRGLLQYHAAGTGRWGGRLFQPQNFPRGTVEPKPAPDDIVEAVMTEDPEWVRMLYGDPIQAVASSLRHAIVAEKGKGLLVGDFSTIEARLVLALAGQDDKVKILADSDRLKKEGKPCVDIYNDMGAVIFGRPINRKIDFEEGQIAKGGVLGCGFGMGEDKFHDRYAPGHSIEFCRGVIQSYRKDWAPEVPRLWYALDRAALTCVRDRSVVEERGLVFKLEDGFLTIRLPSGRKLWYFEPEIAGDYWPSGEPRVVWRYKQWKNGRLVPTNAYGGLLTENVVQAMARDLLVEAMIRCEKERLPVILTVHDEVVTEPDKILSDPIALEQVMCQISPWAKAMKIPVAAECYAGDRYRK